MSEPSLNYNLRVEAALAACGGTGANARDVAW
jgi:hypothetical protein